MPLFWKKITAFILLAACAIATPCEAKESHDMKTARKLLYDCELMSLRSFCDKKIAEDPSFQWYEFASRYSMYSDEELAEAPKFALQASKLAPRDPKVLATLAMAYWIRGQMQKAVDSADLALSLEPENVKAKAAKEAARVALKKEDSYGREELMKLASQAGHEFDVYFILFRHFDRLHQRRDEVKSAELWVKSEPKSALAWCALGKAHMHNKNAESAQKDYDKALELNPNCARALGGHGDASLERKDYKRAIEMISKLDNVPGGAWPWAVMQLGESYTGLGDYQKGAAAFTRAANGLVGADATSKQLVRLKGLSRNLKSMVKKCWLGRFECHSKLGQYDKALIDLRALMIAFPGDANALDKRQKLYQRQGKYDLALKDLDSMIALHANIASFYKQKAECLAKLGRGAEAKAANKQWQNVEKTGRATPEPN